MPSSDPYRSAHLNLPFIAPAQAMKHVTHNEAIRALDALVHAAVLARDVTTPPQSATEGDRYIVPVGASGEWAGKTDTIVAWQDGAWAYHQPQPGWTVWNIAESARLVFHNDSWQTEFAGTSLQKPAFSAVLSANQTGVGTASVKIEFDTAPINTGGYFDTAAKRFQPPAGLYWVSAAIYFTASEAGIYNNLYIMKNGSVAFVNYCVTGGSGGQSLSVRGLVEANGTDFFEVHADTQTSVKTVHKGANLSHFQGYTI